MALVVSERNEMGWVELTPWFNHEPWRTAALGPERQVSGATGLGGPDRPHPRPDPAIPDLGLGGKL
jgi:hypothetical protein